MKRYGFSVFFIFPALAQALVLLRKHPNNQPTNPTQPTKGNSSGHMSHSCTHVKNKVRLQPWQHVNCRRDTHIQLDMTRGVTAFLFRLCVVAVRLHTLTTSGTVGTALDPRVHPLSSRCSTMRGVGGQQAPKQLGACSVNGFKISGQTHAYGIGFCRNVSITSCF